MQELEQALRVSYEHPWLKIARKLAKRQSVEIVFPKPDK
jgi:hypothetical protein